MSSSPTHKIILQVLFVLFYLSSFFSNAKNSADNADILQTKICIFNRYVKIHIKISMRLLRIWYSFTRVFKIIYILFVRLKKIKVEYFIVLIIFCYSRLNFRHKFVTKTKFHTITFVIRVAPKSVSQLCEI